MLVYLNSLIVPPYHPREEQSLPSEATEMKHDVYKIVIIIRDNTSKLKGQCYDYLNLFKCPSAHVNLKVKTEQYGIFAVLEDAVNKTCNLLISL